MATRRRFRQSATALREDQQREIRTLIRNLRKSLPKLEKLLADYSGHWEYEDPVYRFYHQSFKVYRVQVSTERIVAALRELQPGRKLNAYYQRILAEGTGKTFDLSHNKRWLEETRPMLEAFFHARFFLEMAVRYGKTVSAAPDLLPSGWATFLYLYDLR